MERRSHFIKPTKSDTIPTCVVCVGVESELYPINGSNNHLEVNITKIAAERWRYDGLTKTRKQSFESMLPLDFWKWIISGLVPGKTTWMIIDNAYQNLTALGLWQQFDENRLMLTDDIDHESISPGNQSTASGETQASAQANELIADRLCSNKPWRGLIILENPPTIIAARATSGGGTLLMLDMRNFGHEGLQEKIESIEAVSQTSIFVSEWVKLLATNSFGSIQRTTGSQSYYSYRRRFLTDRIWCHDRTDTLAMERRSYYGGRCEVYRFGELSGPIYHVDANSLYHSVARNLDVPIRLAGMVKSPSWDYARMAMENGPCVADVTITTTEPKFPKRSNGITIWPTGTFATSLCGEELRQCYEDGCIKKFHSIAIYDSGRIFNGWVTQFETLIRQYKQNNDSGILASIKRLGLSLYGKFGQQQYKWIDCPDEPPVSAWASWHKLDKESGELQLYRSLNWMVQKRVKFGETAESNPAIAASVTAAGRMRLYQLQTACGRRNCYYSDTDSLWINRIGMDMLRGSGELDESTLGKCKIVGLHDSTEFIGIRHYYADDKLICAGINGSMKELDLVQPSVIVNDRLEEALSARRSPLNTVKVTAIKFNGHYRHSNVYGDGTTSPFVLGKLNDPSKPMVEDETENSVPWRETCLDTNLFNSNANKPDDKIQDSSHQ